MYFVSNSGFGDFCVVKSDNLDDDDDDNDDTNNNNNNNNNNNKVNLNLWLTGPKGATPVN